VGGGAEDDAADFLTLLGEGLEFDGLFRFVDGGGLVVGDGGTGAGEVAFGGPIPVLGEAQHAIAGEEGFIELVGDDDEGIGGVAGVG